MPRLRLIALDLDGTLVGGTNEHAHYLSLRETLNRLRREQGLLWVICSGRRMRSFLSVWRPMMDIGLGPDYLILKGAYIYRATPRGYSPHWRWNMRIRRVLRANRRLIARALPRWNKMAKSMFPGIRTFTLRADYMRLHVADAKIAPQVAELMRRTARPYRDLLVFHYGHEVQLVTVPYTKGLAVFELARHLCVTADEVLAIGDGYNDISMMEQATARFTGCPANAELEVMRAVSERGGHIAAERGVAGVLDVISAHQHGTVRSEVPPGRAASAADSPRGIRRRPPQPRRSRLSREAWVVLACAFTLILVLAQFGMIPGGRLIVRPFHLLISLLAKLLPG
ncbi:MAG: HAD-IIB family hydrolase [Kiritimatiellae bacterium]|nr:HAD-IIB family hydrolase [Kiritimatiellia bacterium]